MRHCILLRGLAREAAHWLDFPTHLHRQLGDDYQIHVVDFPGCGRYFQQPALASVAAMTEHVRKEIARLEINSAAAKCVIGISMGGMIALDWAQRFPDELRGLVLINSSAGDQPFWWRLRPAAWPIMLRALCSSQRMRETRMLKMVSNNAADYTRHTHQWLSIQQRRPVTLATIVTMLKAAARFRPQPTCLVNGLVLASERDRLVSVRASKAIAEQFDWPLQQHTNAGHDLPMDDPQWVAANIGHWLHIDQQND